VLPVRDTGGSGAAARIAQLEAQVRKLSAAANKSDDKTIGDLSQRVGKVESAVAKLPAPDPAFGERLTAAENSLKSLGVALTALTHRSDDTAAAAKAARERADAAANAVAQLQMKTQNASPAANKDEIAALNKRIAGLEQAVKATTVSDRAARLALSAASLRDAVARGEPFAAQLAEVKSLGGEAKMLAPRHLCLSAQVAAPLLAAGAAGIETAATPDEAALLALVAQAQA
jgi:chromosome segregation ATPase